MWVSLYPITSLFGSLWDTHYSFTPFGSSSALSLTSLSLITEGILSYATALCLAHCGFPVPSTLTIPVPLLCGLLVPLSDAWLHSNKWVTMTTGISKIMLYLDMYLSFSLPNTQTLHTYTHPCIPLLYKFLFFLVQVYVAFVCR